MSQSIKLIFTNWSPNITLHTYICVVYTQIQYEDCSLDTEIINDCLKIRLAPHQKDYLSSNSYIDNHNIHQDNQYRLCCQLHQLLYCISPDYMSQNMCFFFPLQYCHTFQLDKIHNHQHFLHLGKENRIISGDIKIGDQKQIPGVLLYFPFGQFPVHCGVLFVVVDPYRPGGHLKHTLNELYSPRSHSPGNKAASDIYTLLKKKTRNKSRNNELSIVNRTNLFCILRLFLHLPPLLQLL